jgi:hypothetical protein
MQALGAFGNILENRGDEWYRQHIPVATKSLRFVTEGTAIGEALEPVFAKCVED